jgi:hypothetical protein
MSRGLLGQANALRGELVKRLRYRHADYDAQSTPYRETSMKALITLAFILATLTLGVALSACSDDSVGGDYYENESHHGYPGPATTTPGRDS